MKLTQSSLNNPVALLVAVLLAIIFGVISLGRLPIQLTPEVEKPEITIQTNWRAAAPEEIESEIVEPQEKVLRGLPGMTDITAKAKRGSGEITVTFVVGMDMQRALLEVINRLNRVPSYPEDAEEPVISSVGGNSRAIAWFILKPGPGNDRPIASYQDYVEDVIQTRFERVPGVALSEIRGGRKKEVRISFDPYRAASLGLELPKVIGATGGAKDVSAGGADVGKRRYSLRFAGKYQVDDLRDMILEWREGKPVRLRDVAEVEIQLVDRAGFVIENGEAAMAINAHRETGVNVLRVMEGLQQAAQELRDGPLKRANLTFEQVYDETIYIDKSVGLVTESLFLGIALAVGILWWFLRGLRATLMVATAIPVSIITTFIVLDMSGRTLNVISLAGLAFAVGMVLDAAIVALENIVRLREEGMSLSEASLRGTNQVWGALFASTVTTVAIFLPVVFIKEEAGQLFADLALTITIAMVFSFFAAITVLPTAVQQWMGQRTLNDPHRGLWERIAHKAMSLTNTRKRRYSWIVGLIFLPLLVAVPLLPKVDYLPEGNRELVFAFILPPPGINVDTMETEMAQVVAKRMQPYVDGKQEPHVLNYFFIVSEGGSFMGVRPVDIKDANELVPLVNRMIQGFPDTMAFARRTSLFGGLNSGNSIDMNIQGSNIDTLLDAAQTAFGLIQKTLPGSTVRPFPELDLASPELRLVPNERRIADAGWTRQQLAAVVRSLGDGVFIGDYFDGEQRLDIILRGKDWQNPESLAAIPLMTPKGGIVPLGELATVVRTSGPQEIRRVDRRRTITLQVKPPPEMTLDQALTALKEQIEPAVAPLLPDDGTIRYAGTADKLQAAKSEMTGTFALAIVILYLLMSAMFRSFIDSIYVIVTIPMATVGGMLALSLLNVFTFQPLDLLTAIGFIILLGLEVNNAILLVYRTREAQREGMSQRDAVEHAIRVRLRPILMSTLTAIFGMLPLMIMPGAGAELYRGLATVVVGGKCVSTVFTLVLLPALLRLGEKPAARV